MDEPLTAAELATLAAHGYEPFGGGLSEDGTPFVRFKKDGRAHVGSRAMWRQTITELTAPPTEDVKAFGKGAWVYCRPHMRPHRTGWCTIRPRDKIGLGVATEDEAYEKCRQWSFPLFGENGYAEYVAAKDDARRRSAVYAAIGREREYQDGKWGDLAEHPHDVGGWLTIMRKELREAEDAWCSQRGDAGALEEILQVITVGVACLTQHGIVERSVSRSSIASITKSE